MQYETPHLIGMTIAYYTSSASVPSSSPTVGEIAAPMDIVEAATSKPSSPFPENTSNSLIAWMSNASLEENSMVPLAQFHCDGSPNSSSSEELNYSKDEYDEDDNYGSPSRQERTGAPSPNQWNDLYQQPSSRMVSILASSSPEITALCKSYLNRSEIAQNDSINAVAARQRRLDAHRAARLASLARHTTSPLLRNNCRPLDRTDNDDDSVESCHSSNSSVESMGLRQQRPPLAPPPPPPPPLPSSSRVPNNSKMLPWSPHVSPLLSSRGGNLVSTHECVVAPLPPSEVETSDFCCPAFSTTPTTTATNTTSATTPLFSLTSALDSVTSTAASSASAATTTITLRRLALHRRASNVVLPPWNDICDMGAGALHAPQPVSMEQPDDSGNAVALNFDRLGLYPILASTSSDSFAELADGAMSDENEIRTLCKSE